MLANDWVDVVLSGAVTVDQLRSNVEALSISLEPEDLDRLARLAEPPETYWTTRSGLPWT